MDKRFINQTLRRCALAWAGVTLAAAARGANDAGATLNLDPITVVTTPDYRPLEDNWQVGEVPGFRIFTHGNSAANRVAEQLQLARAAFGLLWTDQAVGRRPMTVVLTADEPEFLAWARVAPKDIDRTVRALPTPAGMVLLLNGGGDLVQRAAGRGYVMAQLQDTKLPGWLREGLAQIVSSAEAEGDRLRVGQVQQDPRNSVSLDMLRNLRMQAAFNLPADASRLDPITGLQNLRGETVDVRINGMVPTMGELERYLDEESERRADERYVFKPDTDFFNFLSDSLVMSLGKVFDPAVADTVRWRMNAWAFVHYSLFADRQSHRPAFFNFVQQLAREPGRTPVDLLKEAYGMTVGKVELNLALYARNPSYQIFDFKLAEPFKASAVGMAAAPEASVLQLRARVLGASGRAEEARQLLAKGYANPANRTAAYVAQLVALERSHDPARAAELLEAAARREQLDNPMRRLLAATRLERLQRDGARLSANDLSMVLMPLFAALDKGDHSEEVFVLIGRAWTASATAPTPEHLNALRLGLTYYPQSRELADLLRQLEQHS